ncbi:MAG: DNA mismatch repair protein MutT [Citrobacter freundii]|nr:MAG: DNA mismatch repair protein MutT [Citrobacter freundii]
MQLRTAGALIIRDRKLLLAFSNNKQCYYLPGGKIDVGEAADQALCRELAEELSIDIRPSELKFHTHISAPAFGEQNGIIMEQDCFFINKKTDPVASAEIGSLAYFSLEEYLRQQHQAPGAILILQQLKTEGLID